MHQGELCWDPPENPLPILSSASEGSGYTPGSLGLSLCCRSGVSLPWRSGSPPLEVLRQVWMFSSAVALRI